MSHELTVKIRKSTYENSLEESHEIKSIAASFKREYKTSRPYLSFLISHVRSYHSTVSLGKDGPESLKHNLRPVQEDYPRLSKLCGVLTVF